MSKTTRTGTLAAACVADYTQNDLRTPAPIAELVSQDSAVFVGEPMTQMQDPKRPTMPAWHIREATAEDVAAIIALFAIADDAAAAGAPHQYRGASAAPRSEQEVLKLLEHPDIALFVAELEGRVVAQVVVRIETVPENTPLVPRRFAKLHDLVVMPEARAQGIARALVHAAEQRSAARGIGSIELTVWEFNEAARRLYEQLGYATDARRLRRMLPVAGFAPESDR